MTDGQHQQRFASLWREHRGVALKVASMYARGREDRLDLVQDIGMQLWRSFGHFDERRAKFSTWMYRIALNVAISHLRRQAPRDAARLEPLEARHLEIIGGGEGIPERDERLATLYGFIERLDALNRALILLYLEDRSQREMADILGITETNVATKLGRIRQKLRDDVAAASTTLAGA